MAKDPTKLQRIMDQETNQRGVNHDNEPVTSQ